MQRYGLALLALGLVLGAAGQASAAACTTFASASSNGSTSYPGTNVGTVGTAGGDVCQIGDLSKYNGGTGGAYVNGSSNPSNYEFYFDGTSTLTIQEEIGNNGTALNGIDVDLYSLASQTSTTTSAKLASVFIPYTSGPSGLYTLISDDVLAAGWYTLSTSLAGTNPSGDPNYQANFSTGSLPVPEPSSLALLGVALLGLGAFARRRGLLGR